MFTKLMSRLGSLPASAHDHLFTTFAPEGAPSQVLNTIYHQYRDTMPDETVPPQHVHYRALVDRIIGRNWRKLDGLELRRVSSAYVTCFERSEAFEFQLALWRVDPAFRQLLSQTREQLIAELMPRAAAESARRAHFARWQDCQAAPIDLEGETLLDQIRQMRPDDWHEIVLGWSWDWGVAELEWITAQPDCDRSTAVIALCMGKPGDIATRRADDHGGFVRALAARLEGGFYANAEFGLGLPMRRRFAFEAELATARVTGASPWHLPDDLVTYEGLCTHRPKYTVRDRRARYEYEFWLAHVAPPPRAR
jgi:hypothetical protein